MSRLPASWGVTRCVCQKMTFETLLRLAREYDWTTEDLIRETGCGDQCGLCRPYLVRMMETGETVFKPEVLR